eukprot:CAMPEP_0194277552 /NCGR_PEP_ID=MMETSP0169-20130528/9861_1 /TAXON_ID=218684 /ORGANISM="Corethron pennatum, Strain L29A3" /LENGTH=105 /DNA_ID=CAMNT_0039021561 /DNA_START=88 /DNA_END=401 /DNA_ORIENTATION=-
MNDDAASADGTFSAAPSSPGDAPSVDDGAAPSSSSDASSVVSVDDEGESPSLDGGAVPSSPCGAPSLDDGDAPSAGLVPERPPSPPLFPGVLLPETVTLRHALLP